MDHQVEHDADVGAARLERREPVRLDEARGRQLAGHGQDHGIEPLQVAHLQHQPVAGGKRDELACLVRRGGDRLLDQHVSAGCEEVAGDRVVQRSRRRDADGVDAADELAVIRKGRECRARLRGARAPRPKDRRCRRGRRLRARRTSGRGTGRGSRRRRRRSAIASCRDSIAARLAPARPARETAVHGLAPPDPDLVHGAFARLAARAAHRRALARLRAARHAVPDLPGRRPDARPLRRRVARLPRFTARGVLHREADRLAPGARTLPAVHVRSGC